jgi:hypothetical protein
MINSAANGDLAGVGIGTAGYHLTAFGPVAERLGGRVSKLLPGVGAIVSATSAANDVQSFTSQVNACYAKFQ